jgi:hypothetical protein
MHDQAVIGYDKTSEFDDALALGKSIPKRKLSGFNIGLHACSSLV